jgi:hypothetical protein
VAVEDGRPARSGGHPNLNGASSSAIKQSVSNLLNSLREADVWSGALAANYLNSFYRLLVDRDRRY